MNKKDIDMIAMEPKKANAQSLTCFITFIATTLFAIILMLVACVLPAMVNVNEVTCWISMMLEAVSICLGCVAYWIRHNAL